MLRSRSLGILALGAVVCLGLYVPLQRTLGMSDPKSKADQGSSGGSVKPQPQVRLEFVGIDKAADGGMPKMHLLAHVENPSDATVKVLRWNSVLDPQAGVLGAVSLRNRHSAKAVDLPTIKINRQTPPPDEEYIRIEPHSTTSNHITIALMSTDLEDGTEYEALAEGRFMEIWTDDQQDRDPASAPYSSDAVRFTA